MKTGNQQCYILLDVYIRGHGLFRDIDGDDKVPSEMKRDRNKPFVYPEDLDKNTKLFFYDPSGHRLAGDFADSITLSQQRQSPGIKLEQKGSELYHETIGKNSMYVCWPNSSDTLQDPNIKYPHAIFTSAGWQGNSSFFDQDGKVLNYDIGYNTKDFNDLDRARNVWTALIEVTRQLYNGNCTYNYSARSITENNKYSLYSLIREYQSRITNKLGVDHELRMHWVSCRSYAQENKNSPHEGHRYAPNLTHKQYIMGSKDSKPDATQLLNLRVAKMFGHSRNYIF